MKFWCTDAPEKGLTMLKPDCGHIDSGGGTGCVYPDGNGVPMTKPDGDGCKAVDTIVWTLMFKNDKRSALRAPLFFLAIIATLHKSTVIWSKVE